MSQVGCMMPGALRARGKDILEDFCEVNIFTGQPLPDRILPRASASSCDVVAA